MIVEIREAKPTFTIIGSLIAFVLQVAIAPNIAIFDAMPNFLLVFTVMNAMLTKKLRSCCTGFILGLLYDLLAQGALGIMSFVLTIIGYGVSSLNKDLFTSGWVAQAIFLLIASFFGELLHAVFLSILGYDTDFLASLWMRMLPRSIYDALFGLIIFPLMDRFRGGPRKDSKALKGKFD